jgi:hypothetical protein
MTQRLKDHSETLKKLLKCRPKKRTDILKNADDDLIRCICECSANTIIYRNVPLTESQLKKLSPHKNILRYLSNKRIGLKKKKAKIIKQSGGFLLPLLAPILTNILLSILK